MAKRPSQQLQAPPAAKRGPRVHMQTINAGELFQRLGKWRDSLNPLRGLNAWAVTRMVEDAKRGAQADWQWLLDWIEEEDAIYGALVERSQSALSALDWDVLIPEHLTGADKTLAEAQQKALKEFYTSLKGLRASIEALGMARFRGCAFLEKCIIDGAPCLDPVPQEYFVRDGRSAPWAYNASAASGAVQGDLLDPDYWVVRECSRPVGRKAARLYVIKNISLKDWQGFAETFGIPAIFALMPPDVTEQQQEEFKVIAQQVIAQARGTLPAGSDIKTVEAKNTGPSPFKELADWCDSQLVIAGTGGLLTMLSAPGSGTLAGSAHQEAFDLLARREAVLVTEVFQEQVDRPLLQSRFPGQPVLAYWQLSAAEENDPDKVVTHAKDLKDAGYEIALEQLKEKTGYDLTPAAKPEPEPELKPGEKEPKPEEPPEEEPDPDVTVKNRAGGRQLEYVTAADEARRAVAAALNEDFEGSRSLLLQLAETDPASPEFPALLERAQATIDLLAGAEPGTLKADAAFADLSAAGLLEGWATPPGQ
ncbi:MAG: DUF935 family protein [Verrucomicrobiota bacterium]